MTTAAPSDDEPVPKLPRGRGMKFSGPELFRIAVTLAILVAVVVLTKPCSNAVSTFVMGMDGSGSAKVMPKPGNVDVDPYEHLKPGMTDDEVRQAMERARAKGPVPLPNGSATLPAPPREPPPPPPYGSASGSASSSARPPTPGSETAAKAATEKMSAGSAAPPNAAGSGSVPKPTGSAAPKTLNVPTPMTAVPTP